MTTEQPARTAVGTSEQVPERGRLIVQVGRTTVGIFRVDGSLYAYENVCRHQGGPACQGRIMPRVREVLRDDQGSAGLAFDENDMHVVCPWHGFEYSITTGRHAGSSEIGLTAFPVEEEEGHVYVTV